MTISHGDPEIHYDCLICSVQWVAGWPELVQNWHSGGKKPQRNQVGDREPGEGLVLGGSRGEGSVGALQRFPPLPWAGAAMALAFPGSQDSVPCGPVNLASLFC